MERQIAGLRSTLPNPELAPEAEAARATAAAAGAAAGEAIEAASEGSRGAGARPGTLTVRCPERGLKLMLDGKPIDLGRVEPRRGPPGRDSSPGHVRPGRRSAEETLEIAEGGAALVICENLAAATAPPAIVPPQPVDALRLRGSPANAKTPTIHAKTVAYILGGLGVALGGTAIGVYFWNRGQYQAAQD